MKWEQTFSHPSPTYRWPPTRRFQLVPVWNVQCRITDDQLIVASNRAAQPHLNAEELGNAAVLLPPLSEQASIAQHLHDANTEIDTLIEQTRRQIELMEEYRTRLIADLVTGKIDVREAT